MSRPQLKRGSLDSATLSSVLPQDPAARLDLILLNYMRQETICSLADIVEVARLNAHETRDDLIEAAVKRSLLSWIDQGLIEVLGDSRGLGEITDLDDLRHAVTGGRVREQRWAGTGPRTMLQWIPSSDGAV